jgi:hypothetical protein
MSVGGGHANGRFQHLDIPALDFLIQAGRESLVPVVKQKLMITISRKRFPELLKCPLSRRMLGHVEVHDPSRSNLECNKDVENTEVRCDGKEEVARDDAVGMIVEKGRPTLIFRPTGPGWLVEVLTNSSR